MKTVLDLRVYLSTQPHDSPMATLVSRHVRCLSSILFCPSFVGTIPFGKAPVFRCITGNLLRQLLGLTVTLFLTLLPHPFVFYCSNPRNTSCPLLLLLVLSSLAIETLEAPLRYLVNPTKTQVFHASRTLSYLWKPTVRRHRL